MAKKIGRPSTFDSAKANAVCEGIAAGLSFAAACESADLAERTAFAWMAKDLTFQQQYARARETRGDARFERIDKVINDMREGTIDAQVARVQIEAIKWQCGKEAPKRYGERLELAGDAAAPLQQRITIEYVAPKRIEE